MRLLLSSNNALDSIALLIEEDDQVAAATVYVVSWTILNTPDTADG